MPGKVIIRPAYGAGSGEPRGAFTVLTAPPLAQFCRRFWVGNASDPFAQALGFASTSAAALGWELVDETGRITPDFCALLVAEQKAKGGAEVVPLAVVLRKAEQPSKVVDFSTIADRAD